MATFTYTPSFDATESNSPRVRKAVFGDGYEQRVRFGLNTNPATWELVFAERTDTERNAITAFLDARAGVESFTWTTPKGFTGQFVCEEWQTTLSACNFNTIRARFRQVFEPS
jgi:phage-related protein